MKYLITIIMCLSTVGCNKFDFTSSSTEHTNHKPLIATVIVRNAIVNGVDSVVVEKVPRSKCTHCNGTGKLKTGDGLSVYDCTYCYPDKEGTPAVQKRRIHIFGDNKCCPDCICGENCECNYPGECLVNKNRGWPVQRCDGNECRQYWPQDSAGSSYNPYTLGVTRGEIKPSDHTYWKYKNPIPVDKDGNEIKNSQGCPSCRQRR